ncbi:hypothetical protein GCM10023213_33120 [Prosthecobacter algae]|uniref:Ig-like domain-containing protein n=1 Tax=Prosthecobacter algae TaxID=1144682 RepID=A0ABP9PI02_9BACT
MTYIARAFFLAASLGLATANARAAEPRLVVSQVGLHFICTADGQPDMYSWRTPTLDTSPSASPGDFIIPVIRESSFDEAVVSTVPVISGGRTALRVSSEINSTDIAHMHPVGFEGETARLVNLDAVHWRNDNAPNVGPHMMKDRFYSNFPPLRNPDQAGRYGTTAVEVPATHSLYPRNYKRHPGYDPANWNWSLDYDTPLSTDKKRLQGRLHLELVRPPTTDSDPPMDFTLVISGAGMSTISVSGLRIFTTPNDLVYKVNRGHFRNVGKAETESVASARQQTLGRRSGARGARPEDPGYTSEGDKTVLDIDLLSRFFNVQYYDQLSFSSGIIEIKIYNGHDWTTGNPPPAQIVQVRLPAGQAPAPTLITAGSFAVQYLQPSSGAPTVYSHPAVQAPRWWSFNQTGTLGIFSAMGEPQPSPASFGRFHPGPDLVTSPGISAVDPRSNTQRVPGVKALFYGRSDFLYPDVQQIPQHTLFSDPLAVIRYDEDSGYNRPQHYGSDSFRLVKHAAPLIAEAEVPSTRYQPTPEYTDRDIPMAADFVDELPIMRTQPTLPPDLFFPGTLRLTAGAFSTSEATYQWRRNGVNIPGATHTNLNAPLDSAAAAGKYDVKVTNAKGSIVSDSVEVTLPDPVIFEQPRSITAFSGDKVIFSVQAEGTGLRYQWRRNGLAISKATARTYAIAKVSADDQANYDVFITGTKGTRLSAPALLRVHQPLTITQHPLSGVVHAGLTLALKVRAVGEMPINYQWRRNGEVIEGAINDSLLVQATEPGAPADRYEVVVTNSVATRTSATVEVRTIGYPPEISQSPDSATVDIGGEATFSVALYGDSTGLTYQWRRNGVNMPKTNFADLVLKPAKKIDEGVYDCIVSNAYGSSLSEPATLLVGERLTFSLLPGDAAVNPGEPVTFAATAGHEGDVVTYQWSLNGKPLAGAIYQTVEIPAALPADAGLYTVTATRGKEKATATARLNLLEKGVLFYKITGTTTSHAADQTTRSALSGLLLVDVSRDAVGGALVLTSKDGKVTRYKAHVLMNLRVDSTSPGSGGQMAISYVEDPGSYSGEPGYRGALWLQGAQSLIRLDAQTQTLGAKTLSGVMNNLEVFSANSGLHTELENLSLKGVLDLPATILSRQKGEGIDAALDRLRIDLQTQGMMEDRSAR